MRVEILGLPAANGGRKAGLRSRVAWTGGAAVIAGLAIWYSLGFTREPPTPPAPARGMTVHDGAISLTPDAPQWKTVHVGTAAPAGDRWSDLVPARVQIDQTRASKVGTPLGGRVTSVLVELGERVKAGQPLFSVASPEIATLAAEREKATLDRDVARTTLDRVHAMVEARALPAKEEIAARQQMDEADVALKLADSKLSALRVSPKSEGEFTVVAPRSGVVVEKNVLPSEEVSADASAPLVVVADLSTVWVVADLFEADGARVAEGADAQVTVPYLPGEEFPAKVDMAGSVVDPSRHTIPIRLRLDNERGVLRPNGYAEVRLAWRPPGGTVEVGAGAIVSDGARQYVFVQDRPGDFHRRPVVVGPASGNRVVVLSGLSPGERVVEEGAILLDNQLSLST